MSRLLLPQSIYSTLKRRIITGVYDMGQQLDLEELAAGLGREQKPPAARVAAPARR